MLGQPFGSNPAPGWAMWLIWVLCGLGFPLVFQGLKLEVAVLDDAIHIRYVPLASRRIPFREIERSEARTYSRIRDYGVWGIRWRGRNWLAYSVSGDRGVELTQCDGSRVMVGSRRAEQPAQAIAALLEAERTLA